MGSFVGRRTQWVALGLLLTGLLLLGIIGIHTKAFWDYHEPYVAGIIWDMVYSGDWVIPRLNGQPYLEKPPLFYVLAFLCVKGAGSIEPWVTRLPSLLAGIGWVAWCAWVVTKLWGYRSGILAATILGTTPLFFMQAREGVVDLLSAAVISLGFGTALLTIQEGSKRKIYVSAFWAFAGLAFLTKGIYSIGILLFPVTCGIIWMRDHKLWRAYLSAWPGITIGALIICIWILPLALRGGTPFLSEVLVRNSWGRFTADASLVPSTGRFGEHVESTLFYIRRLPGNLFPWVIIQFASLILGLHRLIKKRLGRIEGFVVVSSLAMLLLLHVSMAKRTVYALPLLMPLAILATWGLPRMRKWHFRTSPVWLLSTVLAAMGLYLGATGRMSAFYAACITILGLLGLGSLRWCHRKEALAGMTATLWCLGGSCVLFDWNNRFDARWQAVEEPFKAAGRLNALGIPVFGVGLSETQTGLAVLALNRRIDMLDVSSASSLLQRTEPVAVLVEPKDIYASNRQILSGGQMVYFSVHNASRDWDRAPVLLLNKMANASWLRIASIDKPQCQNSQSKLVSLYHVSYPANSSN